MRPYIFDFEIEDPEDDEFQLVRVEADSTDIFHVYEYKDKLIDFHSIPEPDQLKIREKIETHFFYEDACHAWSTADEAN